MNPPVLRAPNGVVQDGLEFFSAGKPYYDPAKITAPTLLRPRGMGSRHTDLHGADADGGVQCDCPYGHDLSTSAHYDFADLDHRSLSV